MKEIVKFSYWLSSVSPDEVTKCSCLEHEFSVFLLKEWVGK